MTIWVDGDSLPRDLRRILAKRADKAKNSAGEQEKKLVRAVVFVTAGTLPDVPAEYIVKVEPGPDSADKYIESRAEAGDIGVTRDLPFAERLAERGLTVLNDRGDIFTSANVAERRSLRDAAEELRKLGLAPESPRGSARGPVEVKRFADSLDKALTRLQK